MSGRDQRPPRSVRPHADVSLTADLPDVPYPERPPPQPVYGSPSSTSKQPGMVSFQHVERGERMDELEHPRRPPRMPSAYHQQLPLDSPSLEAGGLSDGRVGRKKSLVRPDREKIEPGHRQWHYRTHAAQLENASAGRVGVMPSSASRYTVLKVLCLRLAVQRLETCPSLAALPQTYDAASRYLRGKKAMSTSLASRSSRVVAPLFAARGNLRLPSHCQTIVRANRRAS